MTRDDLASRLRSTFAEELEEQTAGMNSELLELERAPGDQERLRAVFRIAHTLKGAARAVGEVQIEELCHALEELLADARAGELVLEAPHFTLLFETADALGAATSAVREGAAGGSGLADLKRRLRSARGAAMRADGAGAVRHPGQPDTQARPAPAQALPPPAGEQVRGARDDARHLRVHPEKLDMLMASSGQLLISAGRGQSHAELVRELAELAQRLQLEWRRGQRRMRSVLERVESARELELLNAIGTRIDHVLAEATRAAESARRDSARLWRVAGDIAGKVRGLRMRPFSDVTEALPRLVRDLGTRTGKEVDLIVEGEQTEADRAVLDGVREALIHLVRNAVDHGLEVPDVREAAGKPRRGRLSIIADLEQDGLRVRVSDDGSGLDVQAVRERLAKRGLPAPRSDREIAELLFEGGVSTREIATEISGRGVGLDAVRSAVRRIRGSVDVHWQEGGGTTFTVRAPLTLATLRVLLVRTGRHLLAIPTGAVERLLHARTTELRSMEGQAVLQHEGTAVPLGSLASAVGAPLQSDPPGDVLRIVVARSGERRIALAVDDLLAEQEVILRPLERLGAPAIDRIAGASLLPDGRIALVVNVAALVRAGAAVAAPVAEAGAAEPAARRRILVVDDSVTTRLLEQTVLESAGYDVITAVDGVDAWNLLQERGADLVVTDVEMPRMDGIQLCEAIRSSRRFERMPVVLVTSLELPEHRQRGLDAGADAYIVKSNFDQEALIETIEQLLR